MARNCAKNHVAARFSIDHQTSHQTAGLRRKLRPELRRDRFDLPVRFGANLRCLDCRHRPKLGDRSGSPTMTRRGTGHVRHSHEPRGGVAALTIAATGIVFGGIGTSPLYALDQMFLSHGGVDLTHENVLGGISLVIWTLTVIVAITYAIFVLRAENDGEGGVFALYGLLHRFKNRGIMIFLWSLMLG